MLVESTGEKLVLTSMPVSAGSAALDQMREAKETAECQVLNIPPFSNAFYFKIKSQYNGMTSRCLIWAVW